MQVQVADVALDARSGGANAIYTYRCDYLAQVGDACIVPLGNRSALGFIVKLYQATEEDLGFPIDGLRAIQEQVTGFGIQPHVVELVRFVAREYLTPLSVALTPALPPGVKDRLVTSWRLVQGVPPPDNPKQLEVVRTLRDLGGALTEGKGKKLDNAMRATLQRMRVAGIVETSMALVQVNERSREETVYALTSDTRRIENFLQKEGKRKPAQALTLIRLQSAERSLLTGPEIKAMAGVTDTTVKALAHAGLLEPARTDSDALKSSHEANPYQKLAIEAISDSVAAREAKSFLLFGVTGSGKTEVYLQCAAKALSQGRQVLYLVPEIALATQAITQLRERFGKGVAVLHSELAPLERLENHLRIARGECPIVLGPRSALFAGLSNLGLIVMDEEHEASYKQETAPRYHTKRLAQFLAQAHGCPLVLGSATPSIESYFEAEHERITLLSLPQRAATAQLPTVHIEDLREGFRQGEPTILSENLHARMEETLARGEQAILFLNRRAYSSFLLCRDCGADFKCPNCSVSLSFHRAQNRLKCHHCGYFTRPPDECPNCSGTRVKGFGLGTEKVQEWVASAFPQAKVSRLDRDVTAKKGALETVLADFRGQETQILIGTQMVAKGLDFPNVTLVGVIAADISINLPDFRSSERTFQLLSQVAGRAGRGQKPGYVVIQTFQPEHPAVRAAQTHDYVSLYEQLKVERLEAGYPPARRLVNILVSGENLDQVVTVSEEVGSALQPLIFAGVELRGPVDCLLERIQGKYRRHVLAKLPESVAVSIVGQRLEGINPRRTSIVIDVDRTL